VNRDNTVSFDHLHLQIEPARWRASLAGCTVTVHPHLDGRLTLHYGPHCLGHDDDRDLPYPVPNIPASTRSSKGAPSPATRSPKPGFAIPLA